MPLAAAIERTDRPRARARTEGNDPFEAGGAGEGLSEYWAAETI